MGQLVDLSLFAVSPTNDYQFALHHEPSEASVTSGARSTPAAPATTAMKPLPPLPNPGGYPTPATGTNSANRSIIHRMKRIRLTDARLPKPNGLTMPKRASKTLQQRRNPEADGPTLSIPTPKTSTPPAPPAQVASATHAGPASPPMIWLPEEHVWLVANGTQQDTEDAREIYGYYAPTMPAPHSEPTPVDRAAFFHYPSGAPVAPAAPPSYADATRSTRSTRSEATVEAEQQSPVRTQFMSLMASPAPIEAQPAPAAAAAAAATESRSSSRNSNNSATQSSLRNRSAERVSPLFQEAMSGITMTAPRSEALMPGVPPRTERVRARTTPLPQPTQQPASREQSPTRAAAPPTQRRPQRSYWFDRPDLRRSATSLSDFAALADYAPSLARAVPVPGPEDPNYVAPLRIQRRTVPAM